MRWLVAVHVAAVLLFLAGMLGAWVALSLGARRPSAPELLARFRDRTAGPALLTVLATGLLQLSWQPALIRQPWMWGKLACVVVLVVCYARAVMAQTVPLPWVLGLGFGAAALVLVRP